MALEAIRAEAGHAGPRPGTARSNPPASLHLGNDWLPGEYRRLESARFASDTGYPALPSARHAGGSSPTANRGNARSPA